MDSKDSQNAQLPHARHEVRGCALRDLPLGHLSRS
jgi:hypothetical protein